MINVIISSDAFEDLNDGFWFYEALECGQGDYFSSCLRADIDGLRISGGFHGCVYGDYRTLQSTVFPYAIFYTFEKETATVCAVIDCRRDPDWIQSHLWTNSGWMAFYFPSIPRWLRLWRGRRKRRG